MKERSVGYEIGHFCRMGANDRFKVHNGDVLSSHLNENIFRDRGIDG